MQDQKPEPDKLVCGQIRLLAKFRKPIISDLDVHDVLPQLLSTFVLCHSEKQQIDCEKSLEIKAEKLLDILEEKSRTTSNPTIISSFINSLKEKYEWLFRQLTEDVPDANPSADFLKNGLDKLDSLTLDTKYCDNSSEVLGRKFKVLLESGGVPCLPTVAVEREELLKNIKDELETLTRNQFLVISGMAGSGKTVLAIQAISDENLILSQFMDGVFWLAIGKECSENKDNLLAKMRMLCEKLGEGKIPNSIEHGADILRTAFMQRPRALLVLDDVWRAEVIRHFNVGCRTLVTTRDLTVMDVVNRRVKYFKVEEGFSKEESLRLFAQALRVKDPLSLPKQAYEIHCECKGSPMVISLISSLMQDHQIADEGRWAYYLESLTKRKYSKMRKARSYEHESIVDAISLSIESLNEKYKGYYSDFALFQDDVGIPCAVLMTLWSLQRFEVEDIMKDFVRKSMAVEEYDSTKKTYYYSIHDLQLDYLKYQLASDCKNERDLHQRLLERYEDVCNSQYHKLPDDGYIYFYLGYHIYKSGSHHLFPTVYLDLQFVGEKIRVTGSADLLVDIKKYFDFIVCDKEERLRLLEEIQTFAQLEGYKIYGQLDVDIIQIALQAPYLQRVHEQAKKLAKLSPNRLYLEWTNAKSGIWKHPESTVLCSDHVVCAKFVGSGGNHFIAGLHNGTIQLCDLDSSAVCHIFFGHSDSVNSLNTAILNVSSNQNKTLEQNEKEERLIILSASTDKTCKMWDLQSVLEEVELVSADLRNGRLLGTSPSPKLRPDHWSFEHRKDDSCLTFEFHTASVTNAEFAMKDRRVISTSLNEILIWDSSNGSIVVKISPYFESFPDLTYQLCRVPPEEFPSYLVCCAENQVVLLSSQRSTLYNFVEGHTMRIVDLIFFSVNRFCTISEIDIGIWTVAKKFPQSKSLRSRSLISPAGISSSTSNTPLKLSSQNQSNCPNFLQPLDVNKITTNCTVSIDSSGGNKSPGSKSDCCVTSSQVSVTIDDVNMSITAIREDILPKKGNGHYLCSALVKNSDKYLLACGTSDHKIVLWELSEKKILGSFTSHSGWVTCLDFSAVDICTLLSGSEDNCVMVWDIEEEERGTKEPVKQATFASRYHEMGPYKGHFVSAFISEKNTIQVYRDSKRMLETQRFESVITAITITSNHSSSLFVVAGTMDGTIYRVLIPTNISTSDSSDLDIKQIGKHQLKISLLHMDSNGQILISGSLDGSFMVFTNFMLVGKVDFSQKAICGAHFPFQTTTFVVCSQDGKLKIFDAVEPRQFEQISLPKDVFVTCTEASADGCQIAMGTTEDGVIIYFLGNDVGVLGFQMVKCPHKSPVRSLAFDSNGSKLAVGHDNGLITIWKLNGSIFIEEMELLLHKSWVRKIQFSLPCASSSNWLLSCGDKLVFWSLDKGEEKRHRRPSFMNERRRRRSGESPSKPSNKLSLDISSGTKIGRQGKRELLQQFSFRGNYAQHFSTNTNFTKVITVDDTGVFYLLQVMT